MRNVLIPDEVIKALETRMANEYITSFSYKVMRAFFERLNLNGFAKYFEREADGELHHGHKIEDYLAEKQADYDIPPISYVPLKFTDVKALMEKYIELEQQTTSDLYDLDDLASKLGDHATHSWLNSPDTDENGNVIDYALIPYQKIELKDAYDLSMQVNRILGAGAQEQGIGLNMIDFQLMGEGEQN